MTSMELNAGLISHDSKRTEYLFDSDIVVSLDRRRNVTTIYIPPECPDNLYGEEIEIELTGLYLG